MFFDALILGAYEKTKPGMGDPYWYEWSVGEQQIIEMLNQDNNIEFFHGADRFGIPCVEDNVIIKFNRRSSEACEREVANYQLAQEHKVEAILLPLTLKTQDKYGNCFFSQPLVKSIVNNCSYQQRKTLRRRLHTLEDNPKVARLNEGLYDFCDDHFWLARALQIYGRDFMQRFQIWTKLCQLNDLHTGNLGYIKKFQPVIFDYASYIY